MPTQLQLEGPHLPSLLARVKTELGPAARIVRAEKVRTGGIAGFFAKQRFEISVEVDDQPVVPAPASPSATSSRTGSPLSLLELADRVSDTEHSAVSLHVRSEPARAAGDGNAFAALLAEVETPSPRAASTPTDIPVVPVPRQASPPVARPAAPADEPAPPGRSTSVSTESSGFAELLANLDATAGTPASVSVTSPAPAVPQFIEPFPPVPAVAVAVPAVCQPVVPVFTAPAVLPLHPPVGRGTGSAPVAAQLARLGLPAHLMPIDGETSVYPALLQSLRALPKGPPPVNRAGAVLAVVGPQPQALATARMLARDLDLPIASAVVLATSRRTLTDLSERQVLRDVEQAEIRRSTWRRRRNVTIVAVDAPMTSAGALQARAYLAAFGPIATWGAVEATRKAFDVGAFACAVGGFDTLALSAVEDTSDPAAVLELGIPVSRLGERPATPSAWAALLTGRLAA